MPTTLRVKRAGTSGSGPARPRPAAPKAPADPFVPGKTCWYTGPTGDVQQAEVVRKHFDDDPPYYTVRFDDGMERQTTAERLAATAPMPDPGNTNAKAAAFAAFMSEMEDLE